MNELEKITYFAETDARNKKIKFGIKAKDRLKHVYVIGKTGMGKSTLLENMAIQDIQSGNGIAFLDPHGGTAEKLLDYVPENRIKDVVYFAPFDLDYPVTFNIMEDVGPEKRHLVVAGLMATFEKIWADAWSARMAYILQNTLLALLEFPGATLLGVNRMYTDKDFRKQVVDNIKDVAVRSFWVDEYTKYTERYTQEATPAIQNKIGQFASNPLIRNIIGQSQSTFNLRDIMDNKKILIVNLSKGLVGEGNAKLLGSMLITKIYLAAMSRADLSSKEIEKAPNFYFYVDEFQSFANRSFADILSEARKYKLNLTIAHQYIEQMEEEVRDAVFGNVGTMITFRVGAFDAEVLEKEFAPVFTAEDLVNLGFTQIYLKLMIDGVSSKPFSARAMAPIQKNITSFKNQVIDNSRILFARKKEEVEKEIMEWHGVNQAKVEQREPRRESRDIVPKKDVHQEIQKREIFNEIIKSDKVDIPVKAPEATPPAQEKVDENKLAFLKASEELKLKDKMVSEIKKMSENTISLNSLKKEKEGKSPSRENISSLRAALSSVIAKPVSNVPQRNDTPRDNQRKEEFRPNTGGGNTNNLNRGQNQNNTQNSNLSSSTSLNSVQNINPPQQVRADIPQPQIREQVQIQKPVETVRQPENIRPNTDPVIQRDIPKKEEIQQPKPEPTPQSRPEPRMEMPRYTSKNEIPEDILKKLLSLE